MSFVMTKSANTESTNQKRPPVRGYLRQVGERLWRTSFNNKFATFYLFAPSTHLFLSPGDRLWRACGKTVAANEAPMWNTNRNITAHE